MRFTLPNVSDRTVLESGFFMQALQTRAPLATAHSSGVSPVLGTPSPGLGYSHPRRLNTAYSSPLSPNIATTASG